MLTWTSLDLIHSFETPHTLYSDKSMAWVDIAKQARNKQYFACELECRAKSKSAQARVDLGPSVARAVTTSTGLIQRTSSIVAME